MRPLSDFPPVNLLQPPRITFGNGCLDSCPEYLVSTEARKIMVIHSGSAAPLLKSFLEAVRALPNTSVNTFSGIPPEPDLAAFEKARTEAARHDIDTVVAIGGGSVLDVAKLVAALHGKTDDVASFFGNGLLPKRTVRLVCVPTTAGTGSEVSPNAILYDEHDRLKKAAISPELVPDATFTDPALTVTVPAAATAASGIDALIHCLEAYANSRAHPAVDLYALEGIRLIAANLAQAVSQPDDIEARSAVALGSLYGGLCLGPVNTAAIHALSYPLGSAFRLAHGLSNALLLPFVIRFNLSAAPERYAMVARALGVQEDGSETEIAELGVQRLEALSAECGLKPGLKFHGVTPDDVPELAASAMRVTRLLNNNLRELTREDAEQIYLRAL